MVRDKTDHDRKLMLPIKNNIGRDSGGLAYRLSTPPEGEAPSIEWEEDPIRLTADEAMTAASGDSNPDATDVAADWLGELLADGPIKSATVEAEAKKAGVSWASVRRAKDKMKVRVRKGLGDGVWSWELKA